MDPDTTGGPRATPLELDATQLRLGNQSVREWSGHGVYLRLEPRSLYTYARHPDRFPPVPQAA